MQVDASIAQLGHQANVPLDDARLGLIRPASQTQPERRIPRVHAGGLVGDMCDARVLGVLNDGEAHARRRGQRLAHDVVLQNGQAVVRNRRRSRRSQRRQPLRGRVLYWRQKRGLHESMSRYPMAVEYNHDLAVSEKFLEAFPTLRVALRDQRLIDAFQFYEREAKKPKRLFHVFGVSSLFLGLITLAAAAVEVMIGRSLSHTIGWGTIVVEFGSVASIILVLCSRIGGHRARWCQSVFHRERLRQWHFQQFLDGRLISLLPGRTGEFQRELDRRWQTLLQGFRDGYGSMCAFADGGSQRDDLFHQMTPYSDTSLQTTVLEAMRILRFEHQLGYGKRKIASEGETPSLALAEHASLSETVASTTLAGAVVVGALAFFASLIEVHPSLGGQWNIPVVSRVLGGLSLLLAVVSAASRAYRVGFTLPDEMDSYEEYCSRIREFKTVLDSDTSNEEKLRQLERLETEAILELRRFLRMKLRATFIF